MMMLLLLLRAVVVARAAASSEIEWCLRPPATEARVALRLPVQMYNGESGDWNVDFLLERGAAAEAAVVDFASAWSLGEDQLQELRRVVLDEIARKGIVVPRLLCVAIDGGPTDAACAANGTTLMECENGVVRGTVGVAITEALESFGKYETAIVAVFLANVSPRALGEFVRLRSALGLADSRPLLLSVPSTAKTDGAFVFDAAAFRNYWPIVDPLNPHWWPGGLLDLSLFVQIAKKDSAFLRCRWLDDNFFEEEPKIIASSSIDDSKGENTLLLFIVVVVEQSMDDTSTAGTFRDIASSLLESVRALGFETRGARCALENHASPSPCAGFDLRDIDDPTKFFIVLGAHNLQVVVDENTQSPVASPSHPFFRLFFQRRTVLYNFEHVPSSYDGSTGLKNKAGTYLSSETLHILREAQTLWDYSESNGHLLESLGVHATHVPLGFSAAWQISSHRILDESIDVLFYGTLTERRKRTIAKLRSPPAAVTLLHLNAASDGIFGDALDAAIVDAKIVLNLRAFDDDDDDEWKMPRLARLLANSKFVISDGTCHMTDCRHYADGIVFVDDINELKAAIHYFLERPTERQAIARRGRDIFQATPYTSSLRAPIDRLLAENKNRHAQQQQQPLDLPSSSSSLSSSRR